MRKTNLRSKSHCVFALYYHLVVVTKYRHKFLASPAARRIVFEELAEAGNECEIWCKEVAIEKDHVHVLLEATPQSPVTKFIKLFKGRSSHRIRQQDGAIAQHRAFWSPSYCLITTGGAPIEIIRKYIERQGIENKSEWNRLEDL